MRQGLGNYVPQRKPRHCPDGHWRCSRCNSLMRVEGVAVGPLMCDRCADIIKPAEIAVIKLPPAGEYYGRTKRDPNDPKRWPEKAKKAPKRNRVRTTAKPNRAPRPVVRIDDGAMFSSVQEAAKVTSGGSKGASSLYAHLRGKNKSFCGCTFRYGDKEDGK